LFLAAVVAAIALGLSSGHPKSNVNSTSGLTAAPTTSPLATDPPATDPPATDPPVTDPPTTDRPPLAIESIAIRPENYQQSGPNNFYLAGSSTLDFEYKWDVVVPGYVVEDQCYIVGQVFSGGQPVSGAEHNHCFSGGWNRHDLPAGRYHLVVTASLDDGSSKTATYDFTVSPGN
jgi:hypothetical protein